MKKFIIKILLFFVPLGSIFSQGFLINEANNMQLINPSYNGFNFESKAGVIYNTISYDGIRNIDTKYAFAGYSLENLKFAIGVDFVSHNVKEFGYLENQLNLSYTYKIDVGRDLYFLPSIYLGIFNRKVDASNYIFEDQLVISEGVILPTSNDPSLTTPQTNNSFDAGIGAILYNETFLVGLSAKHINQAGISFDTEVNEQRDLSISIQGAYETEIDPYNRSSLPKNSYVFAYASITKIGDILKIYSSQELQFNSFRAGIHQKLTSLEDFSLVNFGLNLGIEAGNINFNTAYSFSVKNDIRYSPSILEISVQFNFEPWLSRNKADYKRLRTFNY